jgi:hypothetical protein
LSIHQIRVFSSGFPLSLVTAVVEIGRGPPTRPLLADLLVSSLERFFLERITR